MRRIGTIIIGLIGLSVLLTACFPTAKPVTAPAPPPKFKLAAGLWRTDGNADGASKCSFYRKDANGAIIPGSNTTSDHGARYVQTADTDSEFVTSGCQPWVKYDGTEQVGGPQPIRWTGQPGQIWEPRRGFADGDYIVGVDGDEPQPTGDVAPGIASLNLTNNQPIPPTCTWSVVKDWSGDPGTILRMGWGKGDTLTPVPLFPYPVRFYAGEGIRLTGCNGMFWYGSLMGADPYPAS